MRCLVKTNITTPSLAFDKAATILRRRGDPHTHTLDTSPDTSLSDIPQWIIPVPQKVKM